MKKNLLLALGLAGMAVMGTVNAASEPTPSVANPSNGVWNDDRWYIAGFGTFVQPGGARDAAAGRGAGAAIGKIINEWFNVEIKGFWQGMNQNNTYANGSGGRSDTVSYTHLRAHET